MIKKEKTKNHIKLFPAHFIGNIKHAYNIPNIITRIVLFKVENFVFKVLLFYGKCLSLWACSSLERKKNPIFQDFRDHSKLEL